MLQRKHASDLFLTNVECDVDVQRLQHETIPSFVFQSFGKAIQMEFDRIPTFGTLEVTTPLLFSIWFHLLGFLHDSVAAQGLNVGKKQTLSFVVIDEQKPKKSIPMSQPN